MNTGYTVNHHTQRGAALLLALSILAIAVALGTALAYLAISGKEIAESNLDIVQTRQLADSGLHEAVALISASLDPNDGANDSDDRFPATHSAGLLVRPGAGDFAGRAYLFTSTPDTDGIAGGLAVQMNGRDYIPDAVFDVDSPGSPASEDRGFQTLLVNNRVIGRYAYIIIDESGKLDPNTVAPALSAGETSGTGARIGAAESEICLADAALTDPDTYITPATSPWFSARHIAKTVAPDDFDTRTVVSTFPFSYDSGDYWNDTDGDGLFDEGEDYPKLDITSDEDTSVLSLYKAFVAIDDPDDGSGEVGDINPLNDCFWLKQLQADGIAADTLDRCRIAAQVSADIKDFRDEDNIRTPVWVTTAGEAWLTEPPPPHVVEVEVLGREGHYGLSEISSRVEVTVADEDLTVGVAVKGEVFYPFSEDDTSYQACQLQVTVTVQAVALSAGGVSGPVQTLIDKQSFGVALDTAVNEAGGTLAYSGSWVNGVSVTSADFMVDASKWQITNYQIDSVQLIYDGNVVASYPVNASSSYWWNWDTTKQNGAATLYSTLEAYDPTNNAMDESDYTPDNKVWRALPSGNMQMYGHDNQVGIGSLTHQGGPGAQNDYAEYNQPMVKNAPFERVGELGRVTSYYPRRTLRFWAANEADEVGVDTGLLSIFMVGTPESRRALINANTVDGDVLTALLTGTTTVDVADAVDALKQRRQGETFSQVGAFYNEADLTGTDATQDELEEELIVKTCELLGVRQNWFTVVVVAQSIQDVGGVTMHRDLNGDGDTYDPGESVATQYGVYEHLADRILATSRLLAVVHRDAFTNKLRIVSVEQL
jgi:hypothetical protein